MVIGNELKTAAVNNRTFIQNAIFKESVDATASTLIISDTEGFVASDTLMNKITTVPTRHFLFQSGTGSSKILSPAYVTAFGVSTSLGNAYIFKMPVAVNKISMLYYFEESGPNTNGGDLSLGVASPSNVNFAGTSTSYTIGTKTIDTASQIVYTFDTPLAAETEFIVKLLCTTNNVKTVSSRIVLYTE